MSVPASDAMQPRVTAIVPTLALAERAWMLERAVDSLEAASVHPVHVLVVVNGGRFDGGTVARMRSRRNVEVLQVANASLPGAILVGRRAVHTEFFCFLDDDDEYFPAAIDTRVGMLDGRPEIALAVTNGYRCIEGVDEPVVENMSAVQEDPMAALFASNWLASCAGLFRSSTVGIGHFVDVVPYLEWTWVAFSLCSASCGVAALDVPTYRIHDTPGSASKSQAAVWAHDALLKRMLVSGPSAAVRRRILEEQREVMHCLASMAADAGDLRGAWRHHWDTLRAANGWRYLPFTRHLLAANVAKLAATLRKGGREPPRS